MGIGFAGVALAFGLTVLTMAYTVGHISGGHFNPAVTFGLWAGGRFKTGDILPYVVAQVAGAIAGAAVLYLIASGKPDFVVMQSTNVGDDKLLLEKFAEFGLNAPVETPAHRAGSVRAVARPARSGRA